MPLCMPACFATSGAQPSSAPPATTLSAILDTIEEEHDDDLLEAYYVLKVTSYTHVISYPHIPTMSVYLQDVCVPVGCRPMGPNGPRAQLGQWAQRVPGPIGPMGPTVARPSWANGSKWVLGPTGPKGECFLVSG